MRFSQIIEYKRPRVRGKISSDIEQSVVRTAQSKISLNTYFKNLGWNRVGVGYFSEVYANPKKNYVIKVNKQPDRSYERFIDFVKQHPNKHFPVVSDVKLIMLAGAKFYIYALERLGEFTSPLKNVESKIIANLLQEIGLYPDDDLDVIVDEDLRFNDIPELKAWINQQPGLVKAVRMLGKYRGKSGLDIWENNLMQRKDGTIVITDPYGFYYN